MCLWGEWQPAMTLVCLRQLGLPPSCGPVNQLLVSLRSASYVGLLWVLGIRRPILRLRERARRSTASPTVPPNSFLEVRPSILPLYHMTQPAKDSSTRRAPVYTSRSPKSRPWISSGAKTPSSRDVTPNRSMSTANTSASLQWDKPSYLGAMAALEKRGRCHEMCTCQFWLHKKRDTFYRVIHDIYQLIRYIDQRFFKTHIKQSFFCCNFTFNTGFCFLTKRGATPVGYVSRDLVYNKNSAGYITRNIFLKKKNKQNPTHLPLRTSLLSV